MSNTNKNQCETDQTQCETSESKYTQVKTIYARAAVILLAVNFCLTGYVLMSVMNMQEETAASEARPSKVDWAETTTPSTVDEKIPATLEKEND